MERRSRAWNVTAELGTSRVSRASGCFSRVGMPSAARARQGHNWAKRIGGFVSAADSPILFSCLSPIPPGRPGGRPLHGRRHLIRHSAGCDTPNAAFSSRKGFGRAVRERPLGCKTRRLESRRVGRFAFPNDLPLTCRSGQALSGSGSAYDHTTPWASMASAIFRKPATLAPSIRSPGLPHSTEAS